MHQKLSLLSFVIPIYNEEETIEYLRQQLEDWLPSIGETEVEILLINDGSKANSL